MHAFFEKTFVGSLCTQCGIISVCGSRLWWYSFHFTLFYFLLLSSLALENLSFESFCNLAVN